MTKEEIYKYLNYHGEYNNSVKKNLKKLIKKYHPDRNNGDDTIMKIINEVKREIESNKEKKNVNKFVSNNKKKNKNNKDFFNILTIISKLNKEVENLNRQIESGYHDEYELFLEYNSSLALYNTIMLNKRLLIQNIKSLKHIKRLDKVNILLIILFLLLGLKNYMFVFVAIMFLYIEIIYILFRKNKIKNKKKEIEKIDVIDKKYKEMSEYIKDTIDNLNKNIFSMKKESNGKKQTIRAYEKIINQDINCMEENYKKK